MNTSLIHLLQSPRLWWIGKGSSGSLSHSRLRLFCLLKLKWEVLHWCKFRFLLFTNDKSNMFIWKMTIWLRVKPVQKIPYYFHIHVPLFTMSHWVLFCKLLSSLKPVSEDTLKYWNNHDAIPNFKSVIFHPRINKSLCCFTLQGCSQRLKTNLINLYP